MDSEPRSSRSVHRRAGSSVAARLIADRMFRRLALGWFGVLLAGSLLLVGFGVFAIHESELSHRLNELKAGEHGIVVAQLAGVRERLAHLRADLHFLRDEYEAVLEAENGGSDAAAAEIAKRYLNFSRAREAYDEIRIVQSSGREAVQVSRAGGAPVVVDQARLRDMSDEPAFSAWQRLAHDEISVSPLALDARGGILTLPHRPTIRLATPVRPAVGEPASIVVNYGADDMLTSISELADLSKGHPILLNAEGYWLLSGDPRETWGFMLPDGEGNRIQNRYPQSWAAAMSADSAQVHTPEGLFTYKVIDPVHEIASQPGASAPASASRELEPAAERVWYVGTFVPGDVLAVEIDEPTSAAHVYILLILFLCVAGSAAGAIGIAESRIYRRMLERLAAEDALTGLANRRSLEDRLNQELRAARRDNRRVTLAFLDVDGFKTINDELGHGIGDQALVDISAEIEANLRSSDLLGRGRGGPAPGAPLSARIGGDEFVILFPENPAAESVCTILRRIASRIRGLSWDGLGVSVSVGVAHFPEDGTTRDSLLTAADRAMYAAKTSGRDRIVRASAGGPPSGPAAHPA